MDLEVHPDHRLVCTKRSKLLENLSDWFSYLSQTQGITVFIPKEKSDATPKKDALDELTRARLSFFGLAWHNSDKKNFPVVFRIDLPVPYVETYSERVFLFACRKTSWNVCIHADIPPPLPEVEEDEDEPIQSMLNLDHFYFAV